MPRLTLLTSEYPPFRGGIGTVATEFAQAAAKLGYEVTVFAPNYLGIAQDKDSADDCVTVQRYRAGPYQGRWYGTYLRTALAAARAPKVDRLVAVDAPFLEALALSRSLHGRAFDAILHGSEILRARTTLKGRLLGHRRVFGTPRRLFANSAFTRDLLLEYMPFVKPERVRVAPLGVGGRWFEPADTDELRQRLGLVGLRLIACVGRITPRKGQLELLRALARISMPEAQRAQFAVVVVGRATPRDREYERALRAEAEGLAPLRTVFAKDLDADAIRALYSAAEILCLPGSARTRAVEGFGLVFLEAAAQGTPAVAGNVGGVSEAVLDGRTGLLVPPDDPTSLAVAIEDLLADAPRRAAFGEAARSHAAGFTWQRFARAVLEHP